jgi:co-chaperonin GroES (HSP10)
MKINGIIKPLKANVFVTDMEFGAQVTKTGLFVPSSDGKTQGITPRWGRVWAIGPDQKDVVVGQWIMVEHGRWSRTVEIDQKDGSKLEIRMIDAKAIMCVADEKPNQIYHAAN